MSCCFMELSYPTFEITEKRHRNAMIFSHKERLYPYVFPSESVLTYIRKKILMSNL